MPDVKLILTAALAVALVAAGWLVNGWRWERRVADEHATLAAAAAQDSERNRRREHELIARIAEVDAAHWDARKRDEDEIDRLRGAVDAGSVRLLVGATCPDPGLPAPAGAARLDHRAGAELDAAARSAYFALRDGLSRTEHKLGACQAALIAVTTPPPDHD